MQNEKSDVPLHTVFCKRRMPKKVRRLCLHPITNLPDKVRDLERRRMTMDVNIIVLAFLLFVSATGYIIAVKK